MTWLRGSELTAETLDCGSNQLLKENLEKKRKKKTLNDKAQQPTSVESWRHRVAFPCLETSVEGGTTTAPAALRFFLFLPL